MKQIALSLLGLILIGSIIFYIAWQNNRKISFEKISFDTPQAQEAFVNWVFNASVEINRRIQAQQQQELQQAQQRAQQGDVSMP